MTLDISPSCTGWALRDNGKIAYGAYWAAGDQLDRLYNMTQSVKRLIKRRAPDKIFYEEYITVGRKSGTHLLAELIGAIKASIYPTKMRGIYPQTWRNVLKIKKNNDWKISTKKWVISNHGNLKRVRHNLQRRLVKPTDDVYDALAILYAILEHL